MSTNYRLEHCLASEKQEVDEETSPEGGSTYAVSQILCGRATFVLPTCRHVRIDDTFDPVDRPECRRHAASGSVLTDGTVEQGSLVALHL